MTDLETERTLSKLAGERRIATTCPKCGMTLELPATVHQGLLCATAIELPNGQHYFNKSFLGNYGHGFSYCKGSDDVQWPQVEVYEV